MIVVRAGSAADVHEVRVDPGDIGEPAADLAAEKKSSDEKGDENGRTLSNVFGR